jgi:undecaprenyl-diphosphatase
MTFEDTALYRDITDFAQATPMWVQHGAEAWTEAGLLVFVAMFAACWWRARRDSSHAFAIAALAPLATAVAYVCSEVLKSAVAEERPCRAVAGAALSLAECPSHGDWSFPSNHATIAGASTVALALVRRTLLWLTAPLALLWPSPASSSACTTRTTSWRGSRWARSSRSPPYGWARGR